MEVTFVLSETQETTYDVIFILTRPIFFKHVKAPFVALRKNTFTLVVCPTLLKQLVKIGYEKTRMINSINIL